MRLYAPTRRWLLPGLLVLLVGAGIGAYFLWLRPRPLPEPGSKLYEEYLRAFQVGVAATEAGGREDLARSKLEEAVRLIPEEPAAWANMGLLDLREHNLEAAAKNLERARRLAPESGEVEALLGQLSKQKGALDEAVNHFRKAAQREPRDVVLLYTLGETLGADRDKEAQQETLGVYRSILKIQPSNLKLLVDTAALAYRMKEKATFQELLSRLDQVAAWWRFKESRQALADVHQAVAQAPRDVVFLLNRLNNVLQRERGYNRGAMSLVAPQGFVAMPIHRLLRLKPPRPTPAPADRELAFEVQREKAGKKHGPAGDRWGVLRLLSGITDAEKQEVQELVRAAKSGGLDVPPGATFPSFFYVANAHEACPASGDGPVLSFPGGTKGKEKPPSRAGILAVDWDNDFRNDLVLAGAGGLRFYRQLPGGGFGDVTDKTGLSVELLAGDYYGAWAADLDADGDLDLVIARRVGPPLVLRNNGDGTFKAMDSPFAGVVNARSFVWADLDNDGMPEAVFLDAAGKLHVFANERQGQYERWPLPDHLGSFVALAAADLNDDGVLDLVALQGDGALVRLSDEGDRKSWLVVELARLALSKESASGVELFVEDLDNNGAADIVVAGPTESHVLLADEHFRYQLLARTVPLNVFAVLDLDGDGRLDLVGLSADGQVARAFNRGRRNYRWQVLRPVANPSARGDAQQADNRINSFAIGGVAEVRAGALVQTRALTGAPLHLGLGEQGGVDVTRVVWPHGVAQWEFDLRVGGPIPTDNMIRALQRLSGSCPFLFTDDGVAMRFAGDFMWGTPLGMHVNGQSAGDFPQTTEWLKVPGQHLVPRGGSYEVRVQANLWETDYFDQLALLVIDHPLGTQVYVDERFPPPPLALHVTTPARPVARAWDHHGQDVTELVRAIDGRYLDRAGRGRYQGISRDHWVEADLGPQAPAEGPVYLIARGWTHPTDSSINVAIEQGRHDRARGLVLEVPDGKGGWKVGRDKLGFPAGKNKTMLIRLDGIDGKGVSRRFRLRTNMEIFWDYLGYAHGLDSGRARVRRPAMQAAQLRYRGILEMTQKDQSSPEIPRYDRVMHGQRWRDLTGYYTRYGDVRELLAHVDDRYVIANAGDEIALRFAVPPGPPPGWQRDFIWESDGWTRDGNLNTRFGNTVLPLPAHGRNVDGRPPTRLEDDPVYRRFPADWQTYHTRYVTPEEFAHGLRIRQHPDRR